jgi:glycerate kinase
MKIVVASDSFKGSMSSLEVGSAVKQGVLKMDPKAQVEIVEVADVGDDQFERIANSDERIQKIDFKTVDLLERPVASTYLMSTLKKAPLAIIETANLAGVQLVEEPGSTTLKKATSFGIGTQIRDAVQQGAKRIIILSGQTALLDGGLGMLQALGVTFYDDAGHLLGRKENLLTTNFKTIKNLTDVARQFLHVDILIASDHEAGYVDDQVMLEQGLTETEVKAFHAKLVEFQNLVKDQFQADLDQVGMGTDGGLGGALALLGGYVQPYFAVFLRLTNLSSKIHDADLVITGKGWIKHRPNEKRIAYQIAELAKSMDVPVVMMGGKMDSTSAYFEKQGISCILIHQHGTGSLKHAMDTNYAMSNVTRLAQNLTILVQSIHQQRN